MSERESLRTDGCDQSQIDRGELPAVTIPGLVSALRQSVLAAYIECDTARKLLARGDTKRADAALAALSDRIKAADAKMTLAMNASRGA